jgi:hypothetical protein
MSDTAEEGASRDANLNPLELLGQLFSFAAGRSNPPDDLPLNPDGTVDAKAWFEQVGENL